jgi:hypothetical protein
MEIYARTYAAVAHKGADEASFQAGLAVSNFEKQFPLPRKTLQERMQDNFTKEHDGRGPG